MTKELVRHRSDAFLVAAVLSLTLFFFGPFEFYIINLSDWYVLLPEFLSYSIPIVLLSAALIFITLNFFKKSEFFKQLIVGIFVFAFLLWFQKTFLSWDYYSVDIGEMRRGRYMLHVLIDSGFWIVSAGVACRISAFLYRIIRKASLALILVQLIPALLLSAQFSDKMLLRRYAYDESGKFTFSSKKNIIFILLDTFQSDLFQAVIEKDAQIPLSLQGFTYFRNAVSGFPTTRMSVPLMLTGCYYDNSRPIYQYLREAYLRDSIPLVLKNNGFRVDLYPYLMMQGVYADPAIASNLIAVSAGTIRSQIIKIYSLSVPAYFPIFIKRYAWNMFSLKEINDDNLRYPHFYDKELTFSDAQNEVGAFKFYHLWGLHPPAGLVLSQEQNDGSGVLSAKNTFDKIVFPFLSELKAHGIYDSSMIFIVADHGFGTPIMIPKGFSLKKSASALPSLNSKATGRAVPLILIKPFFAKWAMSISDSPVALADIPKTLFSQLGLSGDFAGKSMFDIKESEGRERRYFEYNSDKPWKRLEYLPALEEFVISGFSWLDTSWRKTGKKLNAP